MKLKRVVFEEYDVNHAALISKLRTIKVSQKDFFQSFIRLYIEAHPCLEEFSEYLLESKSRLGSRPRKTLESSVVEGRSRLASFNISSEEVEGIFDLLESDLDGGDT